MLEHIQLGDKLRPVAFGFAALRYFERESGKPFAEVTDTITDTLTIIWSGLKDGARREGKEFSATVEDVADWLDLRPAAMTELMKIYGESLGNLGSPQTGASG